MIATEAEASKKFCPHMLAHANNRGVGINAFVVTEKGGLSEKMHTLTTCVGSECMMWCWAPNQKRKGYCGLAGVQQ
jgi:hypothetical protein